MVEIYINSELIDLGSGEDLDLLINYVIQDIRNLGKTNSSFSKTINIPGTHKNNLIFSNIFDFNVVLNNTTFNPLKKADVKIYDGGILLLAGYLKLDEININNDFQITYSCTVYSSIGNLFSDLGKLKLSELDFSEFSHPYTLDNVVASWDKYIIKNGNQTGFQLGSGYVYPYIDYGFNQDDISSGTISSYSSGHTRDVEFFRPSLYAKEVVNKIFNTIGYTYESEFLNSNYFKSLIIVPPIQGSYYDPTIIENAALKATQDFNHQYGLNSWGYGNYTSPVFRSRYNNDYDSGNTDKGGNYDNSTFTYVVPETGKYSIVTQLKLTHAFGDILGKNKRYSLFINLLKFTNNAKILKVFQTSKSFVKLFTD